ncbi:hypothetical protein STCU_10675 [Strigomonas culicis]|uniref:Uncharacterized protein n=1 Tax=Strigomonas culicis TaxID=28005 RepID=S9URW2_9TRYP|nr:hypothetical protein STCU_10675 [Strigomonas culicis]|eukprot:EPY17346.1 hypothetical protein STCU_10675 [Strigomonas culicis]
MSMFRTCMRSGFAAAAGGWGAAAVVRLRRFLGRRFFFMDSVSAAAKGAAIAGPPPAAPGDSFPSLLAAPAVALWPSIFSEYSFRRTGVRVRSPRLATVRAVRRQRRLCGYGPVAVVAKA